jgi:hypothetical protein
MKSQAANMEFTPVYACLVAIVNTKFPEIGELLLKRLIDQFKKGYRRNNKVCRQIFVVRSFTCPVFSLVFQFCSLRC